MNIKEAKEELIRTIKAYTARDNNGKLLIPEEQQRPVFLSGAPGIGKTAIIKQAAAACDLPFLSYTMTHHTRQSVIGLPMIREQSLCGESFSVTEYSMSEILGEVYRTMETTGRNEGILFLDEINCVSETLLPTMLQFLQFKTFGTHKLPGGWIIAAAGNPPKYNRAARDFDIATLDRVKFLELSAELTDWLEYARERELHPTVLSYLSLHPDSFCLYGRSLTGREYVTPRAWEDLSGAVCAYESLSLPVSETLFSEFLHSETIVRDFGSYYRICRNLLAPELINRLFQGEQLPAEEIPELSGLSPEEKLCILEAIRARLIHLYHEAEDLSAVRTSLVYLVDALLPEHPSAITLEDSCKKQLEKRRIANEKRKSFGLLPQREEDRERLLSALLKRLLEALLSEPANLTNDPAALLKEQLLTLPFEEKFSHIRKIAEEVRFFVTTAFGDCPETYMFFTELSENGIISSGSH